MCEIKPCLLKHTKPCRFPLRKKSASVHYHLNHGGVNCNIFGCSFYSIQMNTGECNSARIPPKDKASHSLGCETAKSEFGKICGKSIARGKQLKTEPSAFSMLTPLLIFWMGSLHVYNIFRIIWYGFTDRVKTCESRTTCSELLVSHGSQPNSLRACP